MKKLLSVLLVFSFSLSLFLIPAAADEGAAVTEPTLSEPVNAMQGAALNGKAGAGWFGTTYVTGSANSVDGNRTHKCTVSGTFLNTRAADSAAKILNGTAKLYDINGKTGSAATDPKYLLVFCYKLTEATVVDTVRVFLDEVTDGSICARTLDSLDIALSETGEDGSWKVVYSVDKIYCEKNYQVYEDEDGNQTGYVEGSFAPTKALYLRIAIPETTCLHGQTEISGDSIRYCRITEIELLTPARLILPEGAAWSEEPVDYSTGNAYVSNTVNIETTSNRPFSQYFDKNIDNAFKEGATTMHYVDNRLTDNSINTPDGQRYDLTGNLAAADETHKYLGYLDIDLHKVQYIDNIKVYLDALDMSAKYPGDGLLINGFDLLVSETGKDGSWKTVYSETGIRDEDKYELRDNLGNNLNGERAKQAWIDVNFDITPARYVRFALTESRDTTKYFRVTQFEVFGHDFIPPVEEEVDEETEEPAINSLMLFPLLMRHRQYETETTTTMFGLRVKHLLRSADSITFEKNGITATLSAEALKALNLAGSDKLVVTINGTDAENAQVTVTVNGEVVDIHIEEESDFSWRDTDVVFVGDSITAGTGTTKTYHSYLRDTDMFKSVTAMGVAGSCISLQSDYGSKNSPLVERYSAIPASDLIVVFMGTNDYGHETPLGTISDTSDVSFYGALNTVITGIQKAHPNSRLVFVTPLHRYGFGESKITGTKLTYDNLPNGKGHTLEDYVNAIKAVCDKYEVPVIDLFSLYPINPEDADAREQYFPDGLHPNAAGHEIIANLILEQLSLIPNSHPADADAADEGTEQKQNFGDVLMQYGNKFANSYANDRTRATSVTNIYLEKGQTVEILSTENLKWALAKTDSADSTSYSRYYPKNGWNTTSSYTVAESGYYGLVLMRSDESEFNFDNGDAKDLLGYISVH